jgi:hypothetical protein
LNEIRVKTNKQTKQKANIMMSKPAPEEKAPPSFAQTTTSTKKTSAVDDLERRLAMLGGDDATDMKPPAVATAPAPVTTTQQAPVAVAVAVKGGKNALMVRTVVLLFIEGMKELMNVRNVSIFSHFLTVSLLLGPHYGSQRKVSSSSSSNNTKSNTKARRNRLIDGL